MPTWRASTTLSSRPRPTAPAKRPTSRSQCRRSGCSPVTTRGAPAGRATRAPGAGASWRARAGQRVPVPGQDPRLGWLIAAEGGRHERPGPGAGEGQGRQHQRGRPERRPRSAGGGHAPAEAEPAEQHGPRATGQGRVGRRGRRRGHPGSPPPAPRPRRARPSRTGSGPSASTAHARPIATSANPSTGWSRERRLEVGLASRGEEGERIQVGDREGGHAQPPRRDSPVARIAAARSASPAARSGRSITVIAPIPPIPPVPPVRSRRRSAPRGPRRCGGAGRGASGRRPPGAPGLRPAASARQPCSGRRTRRRR